MYTAEEKAALAMFNFEENKRKEAKILEEMRRLVSQGDDLCFDAPRSAACCLEACCCLHVAECSMHTALRATAPMLAGVGMAPVCPTAERLHPCTTACRWTERWEGRRTRRAPRRRPPELQQLNVDAFDWRCPSQPAAAQLYLLNDLLAWRVHATCNHVTGCTFARSERGSVLQICQANIQRHGGQQTASAALRRHCSLLLLPACCSSSHVVSRVPGAGSGSSGQRWQGREGNDSPLAAPAGLRKGAPRVLRGAPLGLQHPQLAHKYHLSPENRA